MTILEIILISLLWLIVGLFIAFKRDWYSGVGNTSSEENWSCFISVAFAPLNLVITFIRVFCVAKWDNNNI